MDTERTLLNPRGFLTKERYEYAITASGDEKAEKVTPPSICPVYSSFIREQIA
jgi:hypothetical protein